MTENQKLRESIKRLLKAHRITVQAPPKTITDAENQIAEIQNAVKFAEEALALPTAAPVGDLPELPELPEPAAWRTPDEWPMCYQYTHEGPDAERIQWAARYGRKHEQVFTADQMRAYALSARAALTAGDAVDGQSNASRWVASADRYPPEGERVFFMDLATNIVGFDMWAGEGFMWMPSHWMPIPPAPAMRKGRL